MRGAWLLLLALWLAGAVPAAAQSAGASLRVAVAEESFRAEPGGARLAVVLRDAPLAVGEARGSWRAATLEGWMPVRVLEATRRRDFPLAVVRAGGTVYARPDGEPLARALGGLYLEEVQRRNGWVRVRRNGWVWSPSLRAAAAPAAPAADSAAPAPAAPRRLHHAPDGRALGTLSADAPVEVVGREGEWVRVRVEGWVLAPDDESLETPGPLRNVSLRELRSEPDRYRGRDLLWEVQFVALQRADSLRSDLQAGERYILARDPGGEPGFAYIVVPAQLLPAVRQLVPLQRVRLLARVRTGRSPLMGHPVLELLEVRG